MTNPTAEERVWVWKDLHQVPHFSFAKPEHANSLRAVEYMRVLSRDEVEKLASDEGVDPMQLINSLHRTIEGQRKHIHRLQERIANLHEIIP